MYNEVTVFMENKPGKLSKVAEILGNNNIDILALDVADDGQFGILKMLTAEPEKSKKVLETAGLTVALSKVVCVEMADQPGGLLKLAKTIENIGINVSDAYGCILERGKRAVFVVKATDDEALKSIENAVTAAGLKVLNTLD